jgi:hypothetical protein
MYYIEFSPTVAARKAAMIDGQVTHGFPGRKKMGQK